MIPAKPRDVMNFLSMIELSAQLSGGPVRIGHLLTELDRNAGTFVACDVAHGLKRQGFLQPDGLVGGWTVTQAGRELLDLPEEETLALLALFLEEAS